ncbi:MAG: NERD domain-containing protein [Firmicutes bacterium]|nr:NERD domain-containing protein [Bacillota bacterium]
MAKVSSSRINAMLNKLSELNDERKGELGEQIVFEVLKRYKKTAGESVLINTLAYPYCKGAAGNVKLKDNKFITVSDSDTQDEVDVVLITEFRIFLIEVKAYRYSIKFTDTWTYRSKGPVEKSIPLQAEKHARHFYYNFYDVIPDGKEDYIIPIIVIADKSDIDDERDPKWKRYIPVTNLNMLNKTVSELDKPLEYLLDTKKILSAMRSRNTSIGRILL